MRAAGVPGDVHRERLRARLTERFDGTARAFDAVARAAGDLADSGRYEDDAGVPLDDDEVCTHLADAPRGSVDERWNWWLGALDTAFGGYRAFTVRVER